MTDQNNDKAPDGAISGERTIALMAGRHPNGEMIIEQVLVAPQPQADSFQVLKSPVFVRGIARADVIQPMESPEGAFKILQHGGNLCVRVFSKERLVSLEQALTPELEKLGGDLDVNSPRVLVYSIHVSCGFDAVEQILNQHVSNAEESAWLYGNVYDPDSGESLDWWQPILAPD